MATLHLWWRSITSFGVRTMKCALTNSHGFRFVAKSEWSLKIWQPHGNQIQQLRRSFNNGWNDWNIQYSHPGRIKWFRFCSQYFYQHKSSGSVGASLSWLRDRNRDSQCTKWECKEMEASKVPVYTSNKYKVSWSLAISKSIIHNLLITASKSNI